MVSLSDAGVTLATPVPGAEVPAEIIITRTVGLTTEIVAELSGVDDITFNGGGGTDVFNLVGQFTGTDLNPATIEIFGDEDDDTVNIADTFGGTHVVFHGGDGNDSMNGQRSDDIFDDVSNDGGNDDDDDDDVDNDGGSDDEDDDVDNDGGSDDEDDDVDNDDDDDDDDDDVDTDDLVMTTMMRKAQGKAPAQPETRHSPPRFTLGLGLTTPMLAVQVRYANGQWR